jgi:hypothetical protein
MSVTAVFQELALNLQTLHDALLALRTTILEDRPLPGDHVLVDRLGDRVDDIIGEISESLTAVCAIQPAGCQTVEWEQICQTLVTCQSGYNRALRNYWSELVAYEQIADLLRLGRERGGEWRPWSASVHQGLSYCQQPLFAVNEALFHGWQEIANRH